MTKPRIYIVEDEALIAMEISDRLTELGYEIVGRAARGELALEEIPALRPGLVLMDIQLAGPLTGIETAARLRPLLDVPVVFLSAYADARLVDEAVRTGSFGYLIKPFEERELHATVQAALYKHQAEQLLRSDNTRLEAAVQARTAELLSLNTRLDFLLSASPATIYTCAATPPYAATFISANITGLLGYSPQEFLATPGFWADRLHPDDRERIFAGLPELFVHGSHVHEYRFRHQDGRWLWMRDALRVVTGPDGQPTELIGYFIDVTSEKQAEEMLHEKHRDLGRFNRLAVDRELRMIELKKEINELLQRAGAPEKYPIVS